MPKGSESSRSLDPSDGLIGDSSSHIRPVTGVFGSGCLSALEHIAASTQIANFNGGRAMRSPPIPQTELHRFCGQDYDRFGVVRLSHGASRHPKPLKRI
jgi:hypothetical protein